MHSPEQETIAFVVPWSLMVPMNEQLALEAFVRTYGISKFSLWWHRDELIAAVNRFRTGGSTQQFYDACRALFPVITTRDVNAFWACWGAMFSVQRIVGDLLHIDRLRQAGYKIYIVGNVDGCLDQIIKEQLKSPVFSHCSNLFGTDAYMGPALDSVWLDALFNEKSPNEKLHYLCPRAPQDTLAHYGIFKWFIEPFTAFFNDRALTAYNDMRAFLARNKGKGVIALELNGDSIETCVQEVLAPSVSAFVVTQQSILNSFQNTPVAPFSFPGPAPVLGNNPNRPSF